ncbi:hypothetical protein [Halomonas korlensis]|uniref:Uncharacterized protein n=1 Tax=Halomonas korlensis TaxID=463301 RepID=A0A1I7KDL8_9GAMM|nr:hypothetical protein [Halomonas korlensis]SFU95440.1 hypothetical protein SAMN04487955_11817 [Halomonas korlensis]
MYAIEFETDIQNGMVRIPAKYESLKNRHVRVVILLDAEVVGSPENNRDDMELRAMSEHSAGLVEEWHDLAEDEVWK